MAALARARGEEFEAQAEREFNEGEGGFNGCKYKDAAALFEKAANSYKLAKAWDRAGSTYTKLANCYSRVESKYKEGQAYVDAAHCHKKTNIIQAVSCLDKAVKVYCEIGRLNAAARYFKEIAELHESEQNIVEAIHLFEKAADFFANEEVTTSANQCKQKVAQLAAQLGQYQRAVEIYEQIARQSLNDMVLKYGVKGLLFNAGICQLCRKDGVVINNALKRYQELLPTFSGTLEFRLLAEIAKSIENGDVGKFNDVFMEFGSMIPLDSWQTTLLLRVKEELIALNNSRRTITPKLLALYCCLT